MSGASMSPAQAIGAAMRKNGHLIPESTALTPFDELAAREAQEFTDEEQAIRAEAVAAMINWIWEAGPDLLRAAKRLTTYTRLYRPELVLNMSCDEAGALFGQGKAAESARVGVVEDTLRRAGYRHTKLPSNKSESACRKMAVAQKGNKHRANSVKRKARL